MKTAFAPASARAQLLLMAGALVLCASPAVAQAPAERLSDKDVKALINQVDESRDKFQGNLDGKLKDSTLRDATREVSVSGALKDYEDNIKKLKDRFSDDYSASAEVIAVLKQAGNIDTFMQANASVTKGRSEWERHAGDLKHLAAAYYTTFPMPEGATARRINDKETAATAGDISETADRMKSNLDKEPEAALSKADREAVKKDIELLKKEAETVKSRTADGKPATAEVRQIVAQVAVLQRFIDRHPTTTAMENWRTLKASATKLEQAFGMF